MPIDTNSEAWASGDREDQLFIHVEQFLSNNREKAYTADEIVDELLEGEYKYVPPRFRGATEQGQMDPLLQYVYGILFDLSWKQRVDWRVVTDGEEEELYFTRGENPLNPMSDHADVYPRKFDNLEDSVESLQEEKKEMENRVARLESQIQELGVDEGWH